MSNFNRNNKLIKANTQRINAYFNHYKRCIQFKRLWFKTPNFKNLNQILDEMYYHNIINGYKLCKDNLYIVYPKYSEKNKNIISNIKFISRPGNSIFIRLENLMKWIKFSNNCFGILRTRFGFISVKNAIKLKTGGELLVILW